MTWSDIKLWNVRRLFFVVGLVLGVMLVLLYLSSRDGHQEFDQAVIRLGSVKALNIRLDASILPVMLGFRRDYDQISKSQRDLRRAVTKLDAVSVPGGSSEVDRLVNQKLDLIEDFKTQQGLLTSAQAVVKVALAELWDQANRDPSSNGVRQSLFKLNSAFLAFIGNPNSHSHDLLQAAVDAAARSPVKQLDAWQTFQTQVANTLDKSADRISLIREIFTPELTQAIADRGETLQASLARSNTAADGYRIALFVLAVVLLAFSAAKVLQGRRYVRMIEQNSRKLDERVKERTRQLSDANESLVHEIMQREKVESQLWIAQKLESIGQLAAGVAHEINTPTQYVSDNVAFLAGVWNDLTPLLDDYERKHNEGTDADTALEAIDLVYIRQEVPQVLEQSAHGLRQIARIVLAMRSLSHPGSDTLQEADLNKSLEMTAVVARSEWKGLAELSLHLDPELPEVRCDVGAINQVVLNLIVNAAQAIEDQDNRIGLGHIILTSVARPGFVEISVEDDGPGISGEIRHRVFDPFFTTKDVGRGTGQGLALAHRVVTQQHGGTLTLADGQGGVGTRFTIQLPLASVARTVTDNSTEERRELSDTESLTP